MFNNVIYKYISRFKSKFDYGLLKIDYLTFSSLKNKE